MNDSFDVVVIGGGAAGMMAAISAAECGKKVVVLETQERLGRKLRITGKGRCNVTNNCDVKTFMQNVPRNGKFLYSALNAFDSSMLMSFFEELGVPLKTERGRRVFPVSDSAHDIANALEKRMKQLGVTVKKQRALALQFENGRVSGVAAQTGSISCESAIVCTGGRSYPLTGSTGDGYKLAMTAGHTIVPQTGSLVPLESSDWWCSSMQGFSLKNVALTLKDIRGRELYNEQGEMMFTHFGITGPLVLSASAHMVAGEECDVLIDLKPALDEKTLDARILRDFDKYKNCAFKNSLSDLAGRSMIPVLVQLSGIAPDKQVNSITREERQKLVSLFKAFPVHISGQRPVEEAIVTSGGVNVKEVNPRTMESKIMPGLFFAGEVLDLDAYTGGYNLQIAWSTGRLAGMNA